MKKLFPAFTVGLFLGAVTAINVSAAPKDEPMADAVEILERTEDGPLAQKETIAIEVVATIKSVNVETRELTVVGPEGKETPFKVSPKVERLAEMKAGDKVTVEYIRSLAFEVRKPTKEELANPQTVVAAAGKHTKDLPPGVEAGMISHTIVTITALDLEKNVVTFKMPEGDTVAIEARYPENLKRVKVGDTVAVTFTEAAAINVTPMMKGKG